MKTDIDFENKETKILLSKLKFEYFLNRNIELEQYDNRSIDEAHAKYALVTAQLQATLKSSKKDKIQLRYYLEGQVRKMFNGQFLPGLFQLNDSKKVSLLDFEAVGENWAYFDLWQKLYKRKLAIEKSWDIIVKIGSVLGIILSIIKLLEIFK